MSKCIVIATSGYVFIGDRVAQPDTFSVRLMGASNIRRWGTTRGLGQIALEGPTENTVLDAVGDIEIPSTSVIAVIKCLK